MSEEQLQDDQSHYEISLTAGQAFVAFVLLLLSLAASFAFGLMIGRGQSDERLVVRKEPAVITEASAVPRKSAGRIVELGVPSEDFKPPATDTAAATAAPVISEEGKAVTASAGLAWIPATVAVPQQSAPSDAQTKSAPHADTEAQQPAARNGPAYAQLLSTSDQKTAETLAAKLIEHGFTSAYVERGSSEKGAIYRVRVKFALESEARAAEPRLREFSKDVWITKQ